MRKRICVFVVAGAATLSLAAAPVYAVSGNSPKSPGNSTHFSNNSTPCTVSGNQQCPSPNQR
jgi:hypothetical protein